MADISRYPFFRHLRGNPTAYVSQLRNGTVVRDGVGLAFWFRPLGAVLSELPVDDRELPLLFHARTADFQDLAVQAAITYRIVDPATAARRIDFSLDPESGQWRGSPLDQVAGLLADTAQQHGLATLAGLDLTTALARGVAPVRDALAEGLSADARLAETGVGIVGVRVMALRPEPDVEKALQTPTRERVQQDADRATYERRALAVERERAIGENELQTQIELATREEALVAQRGLNDRRKAEELAAASQIAAQAEAARSRTLAEATADATRATGLAEADAQRAKLEAYADTPEGVLLALAVQELAANLPRIENLVLTPDLIAPVLTRLGLGRDAA